jgi:hypothetical protein
VVSNIIEPAIQELFSNQPETPATQDTYLKEFKRLLVIITQRLQEHPVIVAHTENNFDGSSVKRLLANKFELDKVPFSFAKNNIEQGLFLFFFKNLI